MQQMLRPIPMHVMIHNQWVAETKLQMAVRWVQLLTIIDKVQQPTNHKLQAVEMELTIKIWNLARHNNKLEVKINQNHQLIHRIHQVLQQVLKLMLNRHLNQLLLLRLLVLLQSATIY